MKTKHLLAAMALFAMSAYALDPARAASSSAVLPNTIDLHQHKLVVIAETHGSNEIPDWVGQLIAAQSRQRPVVVGLEHVDDDQAQISAYVSGAPEAASKAALLSQHTWARDMTDGRSSAAMLRLLGTIRQLNANGAHIKVVCLEVVLHPLPKQITQDWINQDMADALHKTVADAPAGALVLAYMGALHALPVSADDRLKGSVPAVSNRMIDLKPLVLLITGEGHTWACTSQHGCGPTATSAHVYGRLAPVPGIDVVQVQLPQLSASAPAVPH